MKILRVITRMNVGGPARQVAYLHRAFEEAGHFSKVIYGELDRNEGDFSHLFHSRKNVEYYSVLKRQLSFFSDIWVIFRIWVELFSGEYDVIHTHTAKAGFCGRLAAMIYRPSAYILGKRKLKVIHTYHGHVFSGYFNKSVERKVKLIESFLWSFSDVLITLTPKLKIEIVEHLKVEPNKMKVVPLGIDLEPYLNVERSHHFNTHFNRAFALWIGWVGRLEPIKNPMRFIELANELSKTNKSVGFVLVGDGSLSETVQTNINELALEDQVFLYGWSDNLKEVYSGMDLLINSSDNEGTPVTALEAISSGVPVLATDVGGVQEVLKDIPECQVWDPNSGEGFILLSDKVGVLERLNKDVRCKIVSEYSQSNLFRSLNLYYVS